MTDAPKPKAPRKEQTSGSVKRLVVTNEKKFVPQPHLTQKPFEDLDLKMFGRAAKGLSK